MSVCGQACLMQSSGLTGMLVSFVYVDCSHQGVKANAYLGTHEMGSSAVVGVVTIGLKHNWIILRSLPCDFRRRSY